MSKTKIISNSTFRIIGILALMLIVSIQFVQAGGGGSTGGGSNGSQSTSPACCAGSAGSSVTGKLNAGTVAVTGSRSLANQMASNINAQGNMPSNHQAVVSTNSNGTVSVSVRSMGNGSGGNGNGGNGGGGNGGGSSTNGGGNTRTDGGMLITPPRLPATGNFDSVDANACTVSGWAYDPDSPTTSISVQIYQDGVARRGTLLSTCVADVSRPDVNSRRRITGNHGFVCTLPNSYRNTGNHLIYIHALDVNGQPNDLLSNNRKALNCGPSAPVATGTLSGTDCTIRANQSTCAANFTWNLGRVSNPRVRNVTTSTNYPDANISVTNAPNAIAYGQNTIQSLDGNTVLRQITVTGNCPATAPWSSSRGMCYDPNSFSYGIPFNVTVTTQSSVVRKLATTNVRWEMTTAIPAGYNCVLNGPGINNLRVTTQTGSQRTQPIENTSVYTLRCTDTNANTDISDTATVEIIPPIQEV